MSGVRRALAIASIERYLATAINLATIAVIARLLEPEAFGISVLGLTALGFAEIVRDFGASTYIIQQKEITSQRIRTAFTLTLLMTLGLSLLVILLARAAAEFFSAPGLEPYLQLMAFCFLLGPFVSPIFALIRRDMQFGRLALINVTVAVVNSIALISLAALDFSYMSFAWANLISGSFGMAMGLYFRPNLSIFRPSLSEWRSAIGFARYETAAAILNKIREDYPFIIIGRIMNADAVGLYHRSAMVANLPDRMLLSALIPVALPAFAAHANAGRDLKSAYLGAISRVTAVQWPALISLALLAHPLIFILLGKKWASVAPLVQIMSTAMLFGFAVSLTRPALIAAGAVRRTFSIALIVVSVLLVAVTIAAQYGMAAVAWSMFVTIPLELFLSIYFVGRYATFAVSDIAQALRKSVAVAVLSAAGPLAVVANYGSTSAVTVLGCMIALALAAVGWLCGLWLTQHPLFQEFGHAREAIRRFWKSRQPTSSATQP